MLYQEPVDIYLVPIYRPCISRTMKTFSLQSTSTPFLHCAAVHVLHTVCAPRQACLSCRADCSAVHLVVVITSSGLHQVGVTARYQWGTEAALWEHGDGDIHQVHADFFPPLFSVSSSSLYHCLSHTCFAVLCLQTPSKECTRSSDELSKLWSYNERMVSLQNCMYTVLTTVIITHL